MSRLDDELKLAFRRQEPSADFTRRVLARINEPRTPQKLSLWQKIIGWFQLPTMRRAVAAAVVLLIAAIGVIEYQRSRHQGENSSTAEVKNQASDQNQGSTPTVASSGNSNSAPIAKEQKEEQAAPQLLPSKAPGKVQPVTYKPRRKPLPQRFNKDSVVPEGQVAIKGNPKAMTERERGEQAREQLYKALAITSTLLSEARSVAFGDK